LQFRILDSERSIFRFEEEIQESKSKGFGPLAYL